MPKLGNNILIFYLNLLPKWSKSNGQLLKKQSIIVKVKEENKKSKLITRMTKISMLEFKKDCISIKEFKLNQVLPLSKNLKMKYQFPIKLERLIKKANTCNFSNIIITA